MNPGTLAALIAAAFIGLISALHVYWGVGGRWPGHDERSLAQAVVGVTPDGRMPGLAACLAVALLLAVTAALPLAVRGMLSVPAPDWILRLMLWGATGVLLVRGIGGFFERSLRPAIVGLPYDRLNRLVYSPLCLSLAGLLTLSLLV